MAQVAPVRERGLKSNEYALFDKGWGRSRKGAWIEMQALADGLGITVRRSRKGAWIEMLQTP